MSEYKTFSSNEYPKVGEVCMVLRAKILDESTGKVGPTESFFGKFSIEDGIPYWGAGHRCKPIDQWKLVEFEASPKTQAEPPADQPEQPTAISMPFSPRGYSEIVIGDVTVRQYNDGRTEALYNGKVMIKDSTEALTLTCNEAQPPASKIEWTAWSDEMEQRGQRIKYLEDMSKAQVERIEQLEDMLKKQENAHRALLDVLAMKDAKINTLLLKNALQKPAEA